MEAILTLAIVLVVLSLFLPKTAHIIVKIILGCAEVAFVCIVSCVLLGATMTVLGIISAVIGIGLLFRRRH